MTERARTRAPMSRYTYRACAWCGQFVAHAANGEPLHMHRDSAKCERNGHDQRGSHRGDVKGRSPFMGPR